MDTMDEIDEWKCWNGIECSQWMELMSGNVGF